MRRAIEIISEISIILGILVIAGTGGAVDLDRIDLITALTQCCIGALFIMIGRRGVCFK